MDVKLVITGLYCFVRTELKATGKEGIVALAVDPARLGASAHPDHGHGETGDEASVPDAGSGSAARTVVHDPHTPILSIETDQFYGSADAVSTRCDGSQVGHWFLPGWDVSFELTGGLSAAPVKIVSGLRRQKPGAPDKRTWSRERPSVDDRDTYDISWIPDFDRIVGTRSLIPGAIDESTPAPAPIAARVYIPEGAAQSEFKGTDEVDVYGFPGQPTGGLADYAQSLSDRLVVKIGRKRLGEVVIVLNDPTKKRPPRRIELTTSSPEVAISCLPVRRSEKDTGQTLPHFEAHYYLLDPLPKERPIPARKANAMFSIDEVGFASLQPVRCTPVWYP